MQHLAALFMYILFCFRHLLLKIVSLWYFYTRMCVLVCNIFLLPMFNAEANGKINVFMISQWGQLFVGLAYMLCNANQRLQVSITLQFSIYNIQSVCLCLYYISLYFEFMCIS